MIDELNKIIKREESLRDQLPEHTLDWYTYTNRVTLLNEVKSLFIHSTLDADNNVRSIVDKRKVGTLKPTTVTIDPNNELDITTGSEK